MDDRLGRVLLQRVEHAHRALDVGVHGVERCVEAGARKALGGEMEDVVRLGVGHDVLDRHRVAQVAVEQRDAVAGIDPPRDVGEVVERAAPAAHADDVPVGLLEQELGKVRADHSRDACDEGASSSHRPPSILPSVAVYLVEAKAKGHPAGRAATLAVALRVGGLYGPTNLGNNDSSDESCPRAPAQNDGDTIVQEPAFWLGVPKSTSSSTTPKTRCGPRCTCRWARSSCRVGVCAALDGKADVFASYRSHAAFLAQTHDTDRFFSELYGRTSGTGEGKGGSMHLAAPDQGHMLSSGVVATQIPVAVGAAFANLRLGDRPHGRGVLRRRRGGRRRLLGEHQLRCPVPAAGDVRLRGQRLCGRHAARGTPGVALAGRSRQAVRRRHVRGRQRRCRERLFAWPRKRPRRRIATVARHSSTSSAAAISSMSASARTGTGAIATRRRVERDWISRDALKTQRARLASHQMSESAIAAMEEEIDKAIRASVKRAIEGADPCAGPAPCRCVP